MIFGEESNGRLEWLENAERVLRRRAEAALEVLRQLGHYEANGADIDEVRGYLEGDYDAHI